MNNKHIKRIKEYLATIIVTIIVVTLICLCAELDLLFNSEQKVNNRELDIANLIEFCKIEQLEKRLKREPSNYVVAIRLAKNYEKLQEYSKANNYYSEAVKISNNSPYSAYSYAMFLARQGLYGMSTELAENLSLQNKKSTSYRAQIYEEIAKTLNKNKEFEAEVKAYQIAYKYAKNQKDDSLTNRIIEGYAKSYINLADVHVEADDIKSAILDLNNSLEILELPLAKYKLGLIYQNIDKVKAEKYFSDVLASDIYLINPYIYNKLLVDLIEESKLHKNRHSVDFYALRMNKLQKLMKNHYVFKNEVLISNFHIVELKKLLSKQKQYSAYIDITNNTNTRLDKLYLQVEMFINNKQYVVKKEVINRAGSVQPYESVKDVKINLPEDFEFIDIKKQNDVIVKYYAKKRTKAPWTLIKIESVNF